MTKREIMKRTIEQLRFDIRMYKKFMSEDKREYARLTRDDIQCKVNFLWDIEIIKLDEKHYLEKCLGLRYNQGV